MTGEHREKPWYEHPAAYAGAVVLGLVVIATSVVLATRSGDGDDPPTTATTVTQAEQDCADGDDSACEELDGGVLTSLCEADEGGAACAEIFRRLGEAGESETGTNGASSGSESSSTSDSDRCFEDDESACERLSTAELQAVCDRGSTTACMILAGTGGEDLSVFEACTGGEPGGCAEADDGLLIANCPDPAADPNYEPCIERTRRGI